MATGHRLDRGFSLPCIVVGVSEKLCEADHIGVVGSRILQHWEPPLVCGSRVGLHAQAVAIHHSDRATPNTNEPVQLELAQDDRHGLSSGTDEAGDLLVGELQADQPALTVPLAVRLQEFEQDTGNSLTVVAEENVA